MVLSTAIPILIAAMVIVIISNGIFNIPINPKTDPIDSIFGTRAMNEIFNDLNNIKNIQNNTKTTRPNVLICELNKLCNILLYKMRILDNLILSASTCTTLKASLLILLINEFLLNEASESLTLKVTLA